MKSTKLEQQEVVVEPKAKKNVVEIKHRNTPNKHVFVQGDANAEFEVIDDANQTLVGNGKTNDRGDAIAICSYISKTLKAVALSLICVINIFAQQTTQVNVQQQTVTATAPIIKTGNAIGINPASATTAGSMSIADKIKLDAIVPVFLSNSAAPFSFNSTTQVGNIPQVASIVNGQLVQGDGTPAEQIPDFWNTVAGSLLPDGNSDASDVINHNTDIYVGLDALMRVGHGAGNLATNTAVGNNTLNVNTTGANNVAIGRNALRSNTTANSNIAIGQDALRSNTTGSQNVATGVNSLYNNTSGDSNNAIGTFALFNNTTGSNNVSLGENSLFSNTTSSRNVAIGLTSLYYNRENNNTAIGAESFNSFNLLLGSATISPNSSTTVTLSAPMTPSPAVGSFVMLNPMPGHFNSISNLDIPKSYKVVNATTLEVTDPSQVLGLTGTVTNFQIRQSKGYTNSTALGYESEPTASNQVMLGDINVTQVVSTGTFLGAGFTVASDKRIKSEIRDLTPEIIAALKSIKPKIYKNANSGQTELGVIAQDIPAILRPYLVTISPQVYSKVKTAELKLALAKKLGYTTVLDYTKAVQANKLALLSNPTDAKLLAEKERLTITNDTAYLTDFYSVDYAKLAAMVALVK